MSRKRQFKPTPGLTHRLVIGIRMEIHEKQLTHWSLDLDAAPNFHAQVCVKSGLAQAQSKTSKQWFY